VKHITSRDNPTFKELKALAEDVREQRRQGRTLLDGVHPVAAYCDKVGLPDQLILSEHGIAQTEVQSLREMFSESGIILLRDALFGELSDLATPTGVCAVIRIPPVPSSAISGSCILLDALQDPGNVGSVLRTAAAAGIVDVFLGPGCAAIWSPRVLRAGQGAHFELRLREQADLPAVVREFPGTALAAVARGGESLYDQDLGGRLAWLFGNEGRGLSPGLESVASKRVRIPMAPGNESLNVAAAAAICLFEEVRQKRGRMPDTQSWR